MHIKFDFSALWRLADNLGASRTRLVLEESAPVELIDEQLEKGIEVTLDSLQNIGGFPAYEGRQVLLYIPDHGSRILSVINGNVEGNKFHIAYCSKLADMRKQGRFERYIVTTRVDGKFHISGDDQYNQRHEKVDAELYVCQFCLNMLNYRQARVDRSARKVRESFDLKEFFETYASVFPFRPSRSSVDPSSGTYTADWKQISQRHREKANWHCSDCGVNLNEHRNLLHVHHKDGVKSNNRPDNLAVLCAACHRDQPLHEHMNTSAEQMRKINQLRKQNGLIGRDWNTALQYADPALRGVLGLAKARCYDPPEVEYELGNALQVEIAWPAVKMAITLSAIQPSPDGWKIMSLKDAHAYFDA